MFNRRKDSLIGVTHYKPKLETRASFYLSAYTGYKSQKYSSAYSSLTDLKQKQVSKKMSSNFVKRFLRDELSPE